MIEFQKTARTVYNRGMECPCAKHSDPAFRKIWEGTNEKPLIGYIYVNQ